MKALIIFILIVLFTTKSFAQSKERSVPFSLEYAKGISSDWLKDSLAINGSRLKVHYELSEFVIGDIDEKFLFQYLGKPNGSRIATDRTQVHTYYCCDLLRLENVRMIHVLHFTFDQQTKRLLKIEKASYCG